jgi:hypothetical protein
MAEAAAVAEEAGAKKWHDYMRDLACSLHRKHDKAQEAMTKSSRQRNEK